MDGQGSSRVPFANLATLTGRGGRLRQLSAIQPQARPSQTGRIETSPSRAAPDDYRLVFQPPADSGETRESLHKPAVAGDTFTVATATVLTGLRQPCLFGEQVRTKHFVVNAGVMDAEFL